MKKPQHLSTDAAQFVRELRAADIERSAIVREARKKFPHEHVTRWTVELVLYPKVAERLELERRAKAAKKAAAAGKPKAPRVPRRIVERSPVDLLDGVPNLGHLLAWIERAKQLMPGDAEPALDIATALRRLDLVERAHAYRITTRAGQPASIQ